MSNQNRRPSAHGNQVARPAKVAAVALFVGVFLSACAGLSIETPKDNEVIVLPAATPVVVSTGTRFSNLSVTVDGNDVSGQVPLVSTSRAAGSVPMAAGSHTVTARATVDCSYCSGGSSQLSATRSFVVRQPSACVLANSNIPLITLDASVISVGRTPGRRTVGYQLRNGKGIFLLVEDAPGLLATQMRVETDLNPVQGATVPKRIEGWPACHIGSAPIARVSAALAPGTNVATDCVALSAANGFRSGCTVTSQPMLLDQSTTGWLSINEEEYIDASFWQAFGGRSLRFIWISN